MMCLIDGLIPLDLIPSRNALQLRLLIQEYFTSGSHVLCCDLCVDMQCGVPHRKTL